MLIRYAFYGRLSTDDRQDVTLARPSQLKACDDKAQALGGAITAEFFDQESGGHAHRPELLALIAEARDAKTRRFDRVIVYSTSRLSRDRVDAALFERDLRRLDAPVSYVDGGGSRLEVAIKQAIDEHERSRLKVETRRGQAQNIRNGYRCGGRAPYGYRLQREPHPVAVRAAKGETKSRLVPESAEIGTVERIYNWWVQDNLGTLAIADRLNERGVPSPVHTNTKRNVRCKWAKSTIRAILQNPVYTGRLVWDRTDHSLKRERGGGGARLRSRDEWVLSEVEHPALVSQDLWDAAQARFSASPQRRGGRKGQKRYLLSGLCKCASGHEPLAMFGSKTLDYVYMRCDYGRQYGRAAAAGIEGHGQWCSVREDTLMPLILDFFEQRVFGATRMDRLAKQIDAQPRKNPDHDARARLARQIADVDSALAAQVRGLEAGVDPGLVQVRIDELKAERAPLAASLAVLGPELPADDSRLAENLDRLPDLSDALRRAAPDAQRQVFDAFALLVEYDRVEGKARISAAVDDAVAEALVGAPDLPTVFCTDGHGGGRIRTFEGRANAFTARPL
jgi:site-specific DNA recombinase